MLIAGAAFSQGSQPHVPFSELDPSKGYADEAEYLKAYQEINDRTESPADQHAKPADGQIEENPTKEDSPDADLLPVPTHKYINQLLIDCESETPTAEEEINSLFKKGFITPSLLKEYNITPNSKLHKKIMNMQKNTAKGK